MDGSEVGGTDVQSAASAAHNGIGGIPLHSLPVATSPDTKKNHAGNGNGNGTSPLKSSPPLSSGSTPSTSPQFVFPLRSVYHRRDGSSHSLSPVSSTLKLRDDPQEVPASSCVSSRKSPKSGSPSIHNLLSGSSGSTDGVQPLLHLGNGGRGPTQSAAPAFAVFGRQASTPVRPQSAVAAAAAASAATSDDKTPAQDRHDTVQNFVDAQAVMQTVANPNEARAEPPDTPMSGGDTDDAPSAPADSPGPVFTTARFRHVETQEGHHVITGRENEIRKCEDEPITTPGAVQTFGVLLALDVDDESGNMTVRQVSENSTDILGLSPEFLFRLPSFTHLLDEENEDVLRESIESLLDPGELAQGEYDGPQVFRLSGDSEDKSRRPWSCWVAASRSRQPGHLGAPHLVVLELELERDLTNPLVSEEDIQEGWTNTEHGHGSSLWAATSATSDTATTSVPTLFTVTPAGSLDSSPVSTNPSSSNNSRARSGLAGLGGYVPPLEAVLESTTNHAQPLRAFSTSRGRSGGRDIQSGGAGRAGLRRRRALGPVDVFSLLNEINEQLNAATNLETFLRIAVGVIKDVTLFHRVLVYQFDDEANGKVVNELVNLKYTDDLFMGLMFPACDIPPHARKLYMINKVRVLYDRVQPTARMVMRDKSDLEYPLDMTHCFLRAMSPIHLKYLENMSVRSSMSISIVAFGKLWGMIACHSYGAHGMRVPFPVRQMLRILSDNISRNVERLTYAQRLDKRRAMHSAGLATLAGLEHRDKIAHTPSSKGSYNMAYNTHDMLSIFEADSGLLVINDGCKLLGPSEDAHAMLSVAEYFNAAKLDTIKASNRITSDFPDLILPHGAQKLAGVLYIPLTAEAGQDFIVLFRKAQLETVRWAGKPYKDDVSEKMAVLEPRKSFQLWTEQVQGKARDWTEENLESAQMLSVQYGKFILAWRERQNTLASSQLTAILLSNTSHALRTPLSQIINTLELAMSGNIDSETRGMLENSHEASRALLFHVHDLLDLTRIETGKETVMTDPFDLAKTLTETVRLYQTEAQRRGIAFDLSLRDLPVGVIGDQRKVRTVVSNLVANALQYTEQGSVNVECHLAPTQPEDKSEDKVEIEIVVRDTGCGIAPDRLEAMFVALEGHDDSQSSSHSSTRSETRGVGLGLAVVGRIVAQLGGQLRAESEVGKGTTISLSITLRVGLLDSVKQGVLDADSPMPKGLLEPPPSISPLSLEDDQDVATAMLVGVDTPLSDNVSSRARRRDDLRARSEGANSLLSLRDEKPSSAAAAKPERPKPPPADAAATVQTTTKLSVLVVEDDVINSKILCKRLKMDGHTVKAVENGQEAVDALAADWNYDIVFMDIQMPIMDGRRAAAEIRNLERSLPDGTEGTPTSRPFRMDGRIPIVAVSASLYEKDHVEIGTHFSGWLLKPLNFPRVRALMGAIADTTGESRAKELYEAGEWERGGFFKV